MEIGWNLWGMLPHPLPQQAIGAASLTQVIMANIKKVVVCTCLRRRANRATRVRALLRLRYRAEHKSSQRVLAKKLGVSQPRSSVAANQGPSESLCGLPLVLHLNAAGWERLSLLLRRPER